MIGKLMKKIFLLLSTALFLFTGCAEESNTLSDIQGNNNSNSSDPDNPVSLKELQGTYNITFFGSEITSNNSNKEDNTYNDYYITNDCQKASELFPDIINNNGKNKCDDTTQINLLTHDAVIFFINNKISLTAKIQAEKGLTDKYRTYKYQHITFGSSDKLSGYGIKEYYYDNNNISDTAYEHSDNNYVITKLNDKTIQIDIFYYRKNIKLDTIFNNINVDTKNTYILEKLDNNTIELINNNDYPF